MARRAIRKRKGLGFLYPPQPCGKSYEQFNSGLRYREAYEALAYRENEKGMTFRPTPKRVVSMLATMKHEAYAKYRADCEEGERLTGRKFTAEYRACKRFCKTQVCGRSCVTPKKRCRKAPEPGFCSMEQFQVKLPLEETPAQAEAAGGDTSFDPASFEPATPGSASDEWGALYGAGRRRGRVQRSRA